MKILELTAPILKELAMLTGKYKNLQLELNLVRNQLDEANQTNDSLARKLRSIDNVSALGTDKVY